MKKTLPAANRSTVRPHLNSPCRKVATAARAGRALPRVPLMATAAPEKHPRAAAPCAVAPVPAPMSGRALPRVPLTPAAAPEKRPLVAESCAVAPVPTPVHTPPEGTHPGLSPATLAAAVRNGVVLRSAADRTALFAHWLAPHLPMVHGIVRRHSYFASECADNYQSVVLHLLEHLDALAHFALRCARRPHGGTAPTPEIAEPLQPIVVTADAVMHTARAVDPRPWLAGVTLRLLSTLNGRALRHRATHLTPASSASDEPFDPADPDGGLAPTADSDPAAGAQSDTAPAPCATPHGTADTAPADGATPSSAHRTSTSAQATPRATAARESPRSATPSLDDCLERWHREAPRPGFHRTGGGRLWNAMRARAQQAHSAFAYRAVLRADAAEALAAQPLRDRALVLLTADGWTAEEIGLAVGASPTAVRQTVCRVRTRLRRWRKAWVRRTHATRAL